MSRKYVHRANNFLPDFPKDYFERWDASTSDGMVFATDPATGDIASWMGKCGRLNLTDQSTGTYPIWTPGKVTFAGNGNKGLGWPAAITELVDADWTVLAAATQNADLNATTVHQGPDMFVRRHWDTASGGSPTIFINGGTPDDKTPTNIGDGDSWVSAIRHTYQGVGDHDWKWWFGANTSGSEDAVATNTAHTGFFLGMANTSGTTTLDGEVYECLIYDRALSDAEVEAALNYLSAKWQSQNEDSASVVIASSAPRFARPDDYYLHWDASAPNVTYATDAATNDVDSFVDRMRELTATDQNTGTYPALLTDEDGFPHIRFYGESARTLAASNVLSLDANAHARIDDAVDTTMFCVFRFNDMAGASAGNHYITGNTPTGNRVGFVNQGPEVSLWNPGASAFVDTTNDFDDGVTRCIAVYRCTHNGTDDNDFLGKFGHTQLFNDLANTDASAAGGNTIGLGAYQTGGTAVWRSDSNLYEWICFDRALSDAEITQMVDYLSAKWDATNVDSASETISSPTDFREWVTPAIALDSDSLGVPEGQVARQAGDYSIIEVPDRVVSTNDRYPVDLFGTPEFWFDARNRDGMVEIPSDYVARWDSTTSAGMTFNTDEATGDLSSWVDQTSTYTLDKTLTNFPTWKKGKVTFGSDMGLQEVTTALDASDMTLFFVASFDGTAGGGTYDYMVVAPNEVSIGNNGGIDEKYAFVMDSGGSPIYKSTNDLTNTTTVLGITNTHNGVDDNDKTPYVGNTALTTQVTVTDADSSRGYINVGWYLDSTRSVTGEFHEMLIWDRVLDATERADVVNYLSWKWGAQQSDTASPDIAASHKPLYAWTDPYGSVATNISTGNAPDLVTRRGHPAVYCDRTNSEVLRAISTIAWGNTTNDERIQWAVFEMADSVTGSVQYAGTWGGSDGLFGAEAAYENDLAPGENPVVVRLRAGSGQTYYPLSVLDGTQGPFIVIKRTTINASDSDHEGWHRGNKIGIKLAGTTPGTNARMAIGASTTPSAYGSAYVYEMGATKVSGGGTTEEQILELARWLCDKYGLSYMPETTPADIGLVRSTATVAQTDTCLWFRSDVGLNENAWSLHPLCARHHTDPDDFRAEQVARRPSTSTVNGVKVARSQDTTASASSYQSANTYASTEATDFPADTDGVSTFYVAKLDSRTTTASGASIGSASCQCRQSGVSDITVQTLSSNSSANWGYRMDDFMPVGAVYHYDSDGSGGIGEAGTPDATPYIWRFSGDAVPLEANAGAAASFNMQMFMGAGGAGTLQGHVDCPEFVAFKHPLKEYEVNNLYRYFYDRYPTLFTRVSLHEEDADTVAHWIYDTDLSDNTANKADLTIGTYDQSLPDDMPNFRYCHDHTAQTTEHGYTAQDADLDTLGAFTWAAAVYVTSIAGTNPAPAFVRSETPGGGATSADNIRYRFETRTAGNLRYIHQYGTKNNEEYSTTATLPLNQWVYVACTRAADGLSGRIMINDTIEEFTMSNAPNNGGSARYRMFSDFNGDDLNALVSTVIFKDVETSAEGLKRMRRQVFPHI